MNLKILGFLGILFFMVESLVWSAFVWNWPVIFVKFLFVTVYLVLLFLLFQSD